MSSFQKKVTHKLAEALDDYLDDQADGGYNDSAQEDYNDSDNGGYENDQNADFGDFDQNENFYENDSDANVNPRNPRETRDYESQNRNAQRVEAPIRNRDRGINMPTQRQQNPQNPQNPQNGNNPRNPRNVENDVPQSNLKNFLADTSKADEDSVDEDVSFLDAEDTDNMLGDLGNSPNPKTNDQTPETPDTSFFGKFDFGKDTESENPRIGLSTKNRLGGLSNGKTPNPNANTNAESKAKKPSESLDDAEEEQETLYQWCEQFSYQPGVEYVRLKRLHPKIWEGIPLSGWIEDIYEPMDEQDLMGRWGGGTYMFESIQLDRLGRPRASKKKIVTISGLPTHFVDDQGKPYRLPNNSRLQQNNPQSWREDMILNRNRGLGKFGGGGRDYQEQSNSYGYRDRDREESSRPSGNTQNPQPMQSSSNQNAPSAAELLRMTQAQVDSKKEDHKALEILRSAQNDVTIQMSEVSKQQQEIYKEMLRRQGEEIERMRREQEAILDKAQTPLKEALSVVSNRADNEVTVLKDQIQKLELEARDRLSSVKDEQARIFQTHQKEKEDLRSIYLKQIDDLRAENNRLFQNFQKEKEDLKNINNAQLDTIRQEYRQRESDIRIQSQSTSSENLQALKLQMDNLRDAHQAQVNNIQKESQATINQLYQEISKLREDARERESKARDEAFKRESDLKISHVKEISDVKADATERVNTLRLDHEKKEKEIKSTYELREKDLKERLEEREKTLKESLEGKYQITIDTLKERLEALKSTSEDKIREYMQNTDKRESQMQKLMDTNYKAQLSIVEADRDRLKSELETYKRELDMARREKKELTDPIAKLKEIKNFKSTLQEFGFVSEDDNKDSSATATALALASARRRADDDDDDDDDDRKKKKDEPKGILGQIAHYGPAIATNILAPVLQRVDSATKVANDALETQKQELSNQAKLLELQAQEMQQNRLKMEQENNVLKIRQTQMVQQAQNQAQNFNQAQMRSAALERQKRVLQDRRMMREQPVNNAQVQNFSNRTNAVLMNRNAQGLPPQEMPPQDNFGRDRSANVLGANRVNPNGRERIPLSQPPRPISPTIVEDIADPSIPNPQVYSSLDDEMLSMANAFDESASVGTSQNAPSPMPQSRFRVAGQKPNRTNLAQDRLKNLSFDRKTNENPNKNLTNAPSSFINDEINNPPENPLNNFQESESPMAVSEGYVKLAEFLNEQMRDDVSAEDAANKLKTGMMLGLVPKDVFNEAIQNSFEDLYANVKLAAEQKNFPKLTTPKGETYCQKLYNKLK